MHRLLSLVLLAGCVSEAPPPVEPGCGACHGSDASPAPPSALGGATESSARGVGAHVAHLTGTTIGQPLPCEACHVVPATVDSPGHIDTPWPAEVIFGPQAGPDAAWNPDTLTCTNVYCHGVTISGGAVDEVNWVDPDPAHASCQGCHGFPPPAPHPDELDCGACHETARGGGAVDTTLHIDGTVQVDAVACDACHGSAGSSAPPTALDGATDASDPGVGAHAAHLDAAGTFGAMACTSCHPVPAAVSDAPHLSGATDVVFSGIAAASGTPAYDATSQTCTTHCHGTAETGATDPAPTWTATQGGSCNRCHGFAPPAPHPQSLACLDCHPSGPGALDATHLDGTVQIDAVDCASCHGTGPLGAPPPGLQGATGTSDAGVGQHDVHLTGTSLTAGPIPCATCHPVPIGLSDPPHNDATTDVVFSGLAIADGFAASYDPTTGSCTTYCHGTIASGGTDTAPTWTGNQGGSCNRCHGFTPPAPHPSDLACGDCHPSAPGALAPSHLNGVLDL